MSEKEPTQFVPTHRAVNKETKKSLLVRYNNRTEQYEENWMVALIKDRWDIEPL